MKRFNELLKKRENLTADIFEEKELIEMSKKMTESELNDVDKSLLTYSNSHRLDRLNSKLDKFLAKLSK